MNIYAMYKGEQLLYTGTAEELAEWHGVRKETIYFYATPAHKKRRINSKDGNYIMVIKLEDE